MFLYDIHNMDSIGGPSFITNRQFRSLHLSSEEEQTAARQTNSSRCTAMDTTEQEESLSEENSVHIRLVPNVGTTNRCFVFDVVDRKLVVGGPSLKLGRYSNRTVISDRLSFKSKVVSRYHAEIWLGEDKKVRIYIYIYLSDCVINNFFVRYISRIHVHQAELLSITFDSLQPTQKAQNLMNLLMEISFN